MRGIPIYHGKKLNRILTLIMAVPAGLLLFLSVLFQDQNAALAYTLRPVGLIFLAFAVLYGVISVIEGSRDKKQNRLYQETYKVISDDAYYRLYRLDVEKNISMMKKRLKNIVLGTAGISAVLSLIPFILRVKNGSFTGSSDIWIFLGIFLFFPLVAFVTQYPAYHAFKKTVPSLISVYGTTLQIDEERYSYRDIRKITVSSPERHNPYGIGMFRTITVQDEKESHLYRIDSASKTGDMPHTENYDEIVSTIVQWGERCGVPVEIDSMY